MDLDLDCGCICLFLFYLDQLLAFLISFKKLEWNTFVSPLLFYFFNWLIGNTHSLCMKESFSICQSSFKWCNYTAKDLHQNIYG